MARVLVPTRRRIQDKTRQVSIQCLGRTISSGRKSGLTGFGEADFRSLDYHSRQIAELFRRLPNRQEYADYYAAIPEPVSLDSIGVSHVQVDRANTLSAE